MQSEYLFLRIITIVRKFKFIRLSYFKGEHFHFLPVEKFHYGFFDYTDYTVLFNYFQHLCEEFIQPSSSTIENKQ